MGRICKQCGNLLGEDANYCDECGSKYEEFCTTDNAGYAERGSFEQKNIIQDEHIEPLDREIMETYVEDKGVLRVQEGVNGNEKLKVYKDRFEVVLIRNKQEVTVVYHYYNVKSICADKFLNKRDRLLVKLVDSTELSFFFDINCSSEIFQELAMLLCELKENAPTMEELGVSEEERLQELKDNKDKSKSRLGKKISKFIAEYNTFKELNFFNKVLHIIVPVVCWVLLFNMFTGDKGRVIETSVSPTGAVYNLDFEESKEIVEKAIKESCGVKVSLDDDFRLNQDGSYGIQNHIYVANDESVLGFPLGIEIAVVDEYVQSFVFKTDISGGDFDGLGIIQELYCEVANEVTGDNISLEEIKEIVRNNENNKDRYRNDSIHFICRNQDTFVFYYMFGACSEDFYLERSE